MNFLNKHLALPMFMAAAFLSTTVNLKATAVVSFSLGNTLAANDDNSTGPVSLGLDGASGINFFGNNFTTAYVNNNGNVTFTSAYGTFTPSGLSTIGQPIIAPFFADVDTRGTGSGLVTYGTTTYNGRTAFVVTYPTVGYYSGQTDKLNTFQVILTDRSDTGSGNFDIEFNYDNIQWETGGASGGTDGLGGTSAAVGYSNGLSGGSNVTYQLPGSLVNGALINGGVDALISHSLNSTVLGRYDFQVRNGQVVTGTPEPASVGLIGFGLIGLAMLRKRFSK